MIFWTAAAILTAAVVLLVLRPLVAGKTAGADRSDYNREVYRDQLAELDRDLARGAITHDQFAAARAEIGRRILGTVAPSAKIVASSSRGGPLAILLGLGLACGALAVYLALGSPDVPGQPFAARQPQMPPGVEQAVARLARHLEQQPNDAEGWRLLGESYKRMGRFGDSLVALRKAALLNPGDGEIQSSIGEALTWVENGIVTEEARQAFNAALSAEPGEPRARYYLALRRAQSGDMRGALDDWVSLARDASPGTPWLANVRQQIAEAARQLGLNAAELMPQQRPGPTTEAMAAAEAMTPEQREAMIRGMVESLASRMRETPQDLDGWLRLGRAYTVLGERALAADAYQRAAALAPGRADVLTALLAQLDPKSPDYEQVRRQLDGVKPGG